MWPSLSHRGGPQLVPFDILEEAWNEYTFSDGVVVRTRLILTAVSQIYELGPFTFDFEQVTTVMAPPVLTSAPGEFEQGADLSMPESECQALLRSEKWNRYSIGQSERVARIIFIEHRSYKLLNAFDKYGQPVYRIEGKPLVKIYDQDAEEIFVS